MKSNTLLLRIVRWIYHRMLRTEQGRDEQKIKHTVIQPAHGLKTDGVNSPNIIAAGDVTVNIGARPEPQRETILKQVWHNNPTSHDGVIMPFYAESTETIKHTPGEREEDERRFC